MTGHFATRTVVVLVSFVLLTALGGPDVSSAVKKVDLDGDPSTGVDGKESKVQTVVLEPFPVKIKNVVFNEASGDAFDFVWFSAGPGGFMATTPPGPTSGVKFKWSTVSQVFSFTGDTCESDICFEETGSGRNVGPIGAPGKSLFPSQITLSSAALTSSLIRFFSPDDFVARFGSRLNGITFQTVVTSTGMETSDVSVPAYPPGCCENEDMLNCGDSPDDCVFFKTDPLNCGACGNACASNEVCSDGVCVLDCPAGLTDCNGACVDLQTDPLNCGACDNVCGDNQICTEGACFTCRPPLATACDNECVNVHKDPFNCGACGNVCDFACPSGGTGACSQGTSCICIEHPGGEGDSLASTPALDMSIDTTAAPLCETEEIDESLAPGETQTFCRLVPALAKEIETVATVSQGGVVIASGPFRQLIPGNTPVTDLTVSPARLEIVDESGDGNLKPGESFELFIYLVNLGPTTLQDVSATLTCSAVDVTQNGVSDPEVPLEIVNGFSAYPDIPGLPQDLDCTNPDISLQPVANLMAFTGFVNGNFPANNAPTCTLHIEGTGATDDPFVRDEAVLVGIGEACDPDDPDGESFDSLSGLLRPFDAQLVLQGNTVNFGPKAFSKNKTLPIKLRAGCGGVPLRGEDWDTPPKIVGLEHETIGPVSIADFNAADSANPSNPFLEFSRRSLRWEYEGRLKDLPSGRYIISILFADTRIFEAGFEIK